MDYQDVLTEWLEEFDDEEIVNPAEVAGVAEIPDWWSQATGPDGGTVIADAWDRIAPPDYFTQTKALLRSPHALGAAILRSYPAGDKAAPPRWSLAVALDYRPNQPDDGSVLLYLGQPLAPAAIPPWWEYVPPGLQDFYLKAHSSLDDGVLSEIKPGNIFLASLRFDIDEDPDNYAAFQPCPDPRELVEVGRLGDSSVFLDIGEKTYQGWEIPGAHDLRGGPRPVNLIDTIDAYLVDDPALHASLPRTDPEDLPHPAPIRPRNPDVDWPRNPFFNRN